MHGENLGVAHSLELFLKFFLIEIDVDANKAFKITDAGNSGKVNFRPVVKVNVYLNDQDVPRVRINPTYRSILSSDSDSEERDFITKKLKAARWIVQSIENRRRTMVRVMESIVRAQRGFFEKGVSALMPRPPCRGPCRRR